MLVAIGLVEHHRETWRSRLNSSNDRDTTKHLFHQAQFRRRVAASSLIALVGALLVADFFVTNLFASLLLISVVLLLLGIIFVLAAWDLLSIRNHFRADPNGANRARRDLLDEAERLLAEKQLRDKQQSSENGRDLKQ